MGEPATTATGDGVGLPVNQLHLADTSAWSKSRNDRELNTLFNTAVRSGLIASCDLVALELLRSARNTDRFRHQTEALSPMTACEIGVAQLHRAREVQAQLAAEGHHRGVKPADLVIAAAAESAGLPILHYDHDYDLIASVTGQSTRWLAPRGELP